MPLPNPILVDKAVCDPTLFCTALKQQQFYMFMCSRPKCIFFFFCTGIDTGTQLNSTVAVGCFHFYRDGSSKSSNCNIFNECLTCKSQLITAAAAVPAAASSATIFIMLGDAPVAVPTADAQGSGELHRTHTQHSSQAALCIKAQADMQG